LDRNPAWLYKTLVVGVIALFIGMGVQPAVAVTPDSEEECELCPKVSKSLLKNEPICELLGNLLMRLEPWGALFEGIFNNNVDNPISIRFLIACIGLGLVNIFWIPICFLAFEVFDCIDWKT
jgi:hypothetical protein